MCTVVPCGCRRCMSTTRTCNPWVGPDRFVWPAQPFLSQVLAWVSFVTTWLLEGWSVKLKSLSPVWRKANRIIFSALHIYGCLWPTSKGCFAKPEEYRSRLGRACFMKRLSFATFQCQLNVISPATERFVLACSWSWLFRSVHLRWRGPFFTRNGNPMTWKRVIVSEEFELAEDDTHGAQRYLSKQQAFRDHVAASKTSIGFGLSVWVSQSVRSYRLVRSNMVQLCCHLFWPNMCTAPSACPRQAILHNGERNILTYLRYHTM